MPGENASGRDAGAMRFCPFGPSRELKRGQHVSQGAVAGFPDRLCGANELFWQRWVSYLYAVQAQHLRLRGDSQNGENSDRALSWRIWGSARVHPVGESSGAPWRSDLLELCRRCRRVKPPLADLQRTWHANSDSRPNLSAMQPSKSRLSLPRSRKNITSIFYLRPYRW